MGALSRRVLCSLELSATNLLHMYPQRGMHMCLLLPHQASGCDHYFGLGPSCTSCIGHVFFSAYSPTKSLACSLSKASNPRSSVMARPAGFSLWTTPIFRLVVKAGQTKRNVRDLVFPAPKMLATASVDLPDCRAAAREKATDMMWALSVWGSLAQLPAKHSC